MSYFPHNMFCPCGADRHYVDCCQPFHQHMAFADTAETLMRSRFSAFYIGSVTCQDNKALSQEMAVYLSMTCLNEGEVAEEQRKSIDQLISHFRVRQWLSLRILAVEKGQSTDKVGIVEFVAFYHNQNQDNHADPEQLHEVSQFIRKDARWYYTSGHFKPPMWVIA